MLGIEIVSFSDIEVGDDVLVRHRLKHASFYVDVVEELLILALFEVVHNRDLRRVVFKHQLNRHGRHQTTRDRQFG